MHWLLQQMHAFSSPVCRSFLSAFWRNYWFRIFRFFSCLSKGCHRRLQAMMRLQLINYNRFEAMIIEWIWILIIIWWLYLTIKKICNKECQNFESTMQSKIKKKIWVCNTGWKVTTLVIKVKAKYLPTIPSLLLNEDVTRVLWGWSIKKVWAQLSK